MLATFAEALGAGDLAAATACLSRDACLITPDATVISGRAAIRPILIQMIALGTRPRHGNQSLVEAGAVALGRDPWITATDGSPAGATERGSSSTVVLRRVEEEGWKLQILAPWEGRYRKVNR